MNSGKILIDATTILTSYDKGNGCYKGNLSHVDWDESDISWLVAVGLFELSKMDIDTVIELRRLKAVSLKHSLLIAKASTGKYDFTSLLSACTFVLKIDSNLQQFTFKRESKTLKINLDLLKTQLALLDLELITEDSITRSGSEITNYFYDVKQTTTI